jgi:hypothetical protein
MPVIAVFENAAVPSVVTEANGGIAERELQL